MARRHRTPGDDPDEYWAICEECDGEGTVQVDMWDEAGEDTWTETGECPVCGGLGFYAATPSDFL